MEHTTLFQHSLPAANYFFVNQDYRQTNIPVKVISVEDYKNLHCFDINTSQVDVIYFSYNIVVKCLILHTC